MYFPFLSLHDRLCLFAHLLVCQLPPPHTHTDTDTQSPNHVVSLTLLLLLFMLYIGVQCIITNVRNISTAHYSSSEIIHVVLFYLSLRLFWILTLLRCPFVRSDKLEDSGCNFGFSNTLQKKYENCRQIEEINETSRKSEQKPRKYYFGTRFVHHSSQLRRKPSARAEYHTRILWFRG